MHDPVKFDPMIHGIVTGDWSYAKDMAIAGAVGFITGGPIGAATAMAMTAFMRLPITQWATENYAHYYFDNVLGMRPSTAYTWSYVTISTAASLGFERAFANMTAQPGTMEDFDINNPRHRELMESERYGYNSYGDSPTNPAKSWVANDNSNLKVITGKNGKMALVGDTKYAGVAVHTGANSNSFPKALDLHNPSSIPFQKGTTFGFCHQATNATLLKSGFSNVVTQTSGNFSTYVTTAVYGNYGGGLVQKAYNGYQAHSQWESGE